MDLAEISRSDYTMFHVEHFKFFFVDSLRNRAIDVADKHLQVHIDELLINNILRRRVQFWMEVVDQQDDSALTRLTYYF